MRDNRTRVVHVFGIMEPGGAELRTVELMQAMSETVVPTFVTLSGRTGSLTERIEQSGGSVIPLRLGPSFPHQFRHVLHAQRAQVLHSHVQDFSGVLVSAARVAGVPSRISHYHSDGDGARATWRRRSYRLVMRELVRVSSTAVVGVSPTTLDAVWGPRWRLDEKFTVIPNAFTPNPRVELPSLRERFGIPSDAPLLGHVGRPAPEKNREFLIAVLGNLERNVHLVFIGPPDGPADTALRAAADRAGLGNRVHLAGLCDDPQNIMRQIDVLLLPSLREGLPGVVVEARVAGTPVVANTLPGTVFIAEQLGGVTTLSVEGGAERWTDVVRTTLREPRTAPQEALRAFERSPFQLGKTLPRWERLYAAPR